MKSVIPVKWFLMLIAACGVLCCANAVYAAGEEPENADLRIERVALFKNGLGFFTSSAALPGNASTVRLGQLPVPVFGTFWVGYSKVVALRNLVTTMEEFEERVPVQSLADLLQANAGAKATIRTGPGEEDVVTGVILQSGSEGTDWQPPTPYFMDARRPSDPYGRVPPPIGRGNVVLVKTDNGIIAINPGSVLRADFEGENVVRYATARLKRPAIRMELERPAADERVSVSYLARGVAWLPSYLIDLSDPAMARLSAKALVINELADFAGVALELVTGFPNIKFGEILSPVAMSQDLADFLNTLAGGRREEGRRDQYMVAQQAYLSNVADSGGYGGVYSTPLPPAPSYSTAAEGVVSEDLFLYPVQDFTLKKGETACVPLFSAEMPYKHVYTWKIEDILDGDDQRNANVQREEGKKAEEVWHCCRLTNNLKMPLTTAAAEFLADGQFVGQDVCFYTAPGAETTIRINRAMNVLAEQAEVETERTRNAEVFNERQYDLVKIRGELRLRSKIDKPVSVEISKELSGEVLEKSVDAKDVQTAKGLKQVNPKHVLTWEIELQPGDDREISYVYQVYIRN